MGEALKKKMNSMKREKKKLKKMMRPMKMEKITIEEALKKMKGLMKKKMKL
jgi:hypothetical protein